VAEEDLVSIDEETSHDLMYANGLALTHAIPVSHLGEPLPAARKMLDHRSLVPRSLMYDFLMRSSWRALVALPAALSILTVVTLVGPDAPSSAAFPDGCITAPSGDGNCPAGSPQISTAAPRAGLGATATGAVYAAGNRLAGVSGLGLAQPIVGIATPSSSPTDAYWLAGADGGVFTFGDLTFFGSMGGHVLNRPIVGIAADNTSGYWLVASDGGIFAFGGAKFFGSMGGRPLNQPIVGMAPTSDGQGYWLVAADGGVFSFGDARFYGSVGGQSLTTPIVGMASTSDNGGYWLASSDGGIFAYGDAPFNGAEVTLGQPVIGISDNSCDPVPGTTCLDTYAVALANGQIYQNPGFVQGIPPV
jgi:hypothetical protein